MDPVRFPPLPEHKKEFHYLNSGGQHRCFPGHDNCRSSSRFSASLEFRTGTTVFCAGSGSDRSRLGTSIATPSPKLFPWIGSALTIPDCCGIFQPALQGLMCSRDAAVRPASSDLGDAFHKWSCCVLPRYRVCDQRTCEFRITQGAHRFPHQAYR